MGVKLAVVGVGQGLDELGVREEPVGPEGERYSVACLRLRVEG